MIEFQVSDAPTVIAGGTLIATVVLVILTLILLRYTKALSQASNGLTSATNSLAKTQIRPKIVLWRAPHRQGDTGSVVVYLMNKGIGPALDVRLDAKVGDSPYSSVDKVVGGERSLDPITGLVSFEIQDAVPGRFNLELKVFYTDISGTQYEENFGGLRV